MINEPATTAAPGRATDAALPRPEETLGFLLNQLAGVVRERTEVALEPLSITPRSLGLLLVLAEQPGVSQTELGRRLRMDRTTVSQVVDALTRGRLIRREVATEDRRNHQLLLTAKGWSTVRKATVLVSEVEQTCGELVQIRRVKRDLTRLLAVSIEAEGPV